MPNRINSLFQKIIIETIKRNYKRKKITLTNALIQQESTAYKVVFSHFVKDNFFMLLGILSAGFGLKGFLLPNGFIDGGVTGISLLTNVKTGISLSVLIVVINLPFIILGFSTIGKNFAIRSIVAIVLLSLAILIIPYPVITQDKLLIAAFGGFFLGLGIGLTVRGGAVIDGTEVLAIYIGRKTNMTMGDVILIFNVIIFSFGAWILSVEIALYAILTYLVASKTVDYIIDGIEEYMGVSIISAKSEDIRMAIIENLGRGCTIYLGKNGYGKKGSNLKEIDVVYTVITRLELTKLKNEIDKIDTDAFIIMNSIKDAKGGMIKKRPFKG